MTEHNQTCGEINWPLLLERTIEGQEAALACQSELANYVEFAVDVHGTGKLRHARQIIEAHRKSNAQAREAVRVVREAALLAAVQKQGRLSL